MKVEKVVLTIAGSDSGGGAGIQADLKTMSAIGVFGTSVITSVTAQNTQGVRDVLALPQSLVISQMEAVFEDFQVGAVKIGMLSEGDIARKVADFLRRHRVHNLVIDPVMIATSGDRLTDNEVLQVYKTELFPLAKIITPNLPETEWLLNRKISTPLAMQQAAKELLAFGSESVLVKGGHLPGKTMTDVWYSHSFPTPFIIQTDHVETTNTHGTGCTLSSAIASYLALGFSMKQAVELGIAYTHSAILYAKNTSIGCGHSPVQHFWNIKHHTPIHVVEEKTLQNICPQNE